MRKQVYVDTLTVPRIKHSIRGELELESDAIHAGGV